MRLDQRGLVWKDDSSGELMPSWTIDPDIATIESVSIAHLPPNFRDAKATFFGEGALNKLYQIKSPSHPETQYLMRVLLPVELFYKTESEVATLAYLCKHMLILVSKVVAYDSSAKNSIGFEWVLVKKINGTCLQDVWKEISCSDKENLTLQIATFLKELYKLEFTQMGSLYFSAVADKVAGTKHPARRTDGQNVNTDIGNDFVISRIVSPWFWRDKRVWLPRNRGPFDSTHDLMLAEAKMQTERLKNLSPLPTDEYFSETDQEIAEELEMALKTSYGCERAVPIIFPQTQGDERAMILHHDLSLNNIIVDPKDNY